MITEQVARFVDWVRVDYPAGVPREDCTPLLMLLRRRLADHEVGQVCEALVASGQMPADRIDVAVEITKVIDVLPSPRDVRRVMEGLALAGWPVEPDWPGSRN